MLARDICIVGGGLVGLTAALAFAAQGRCVTLLESSPLTTEAPGLLDARSLALSYSSLQIYRALGLLDAIQAVSAGIQHIHVSSAGRFGVTRLSASELGLDSMGRVIEYHELLRILLESVAADANIEMVSPAQFQALSQDDAGVEITYDTASASSTVSAKLLVVADGANSSVRDFLGMSARSTDFGQSAIIANVQLDADGDGVAYERFTSHGPLALLPLPQHRYALVWSNTPQKAEQIMALDDAAFLQALHRDFGYRLGHFKAVGERSLFALRLTRANELVNGRCVFIGNAANTLHPVAGQGLNLALRDVAALFDGMKSIDFQNAADGAVSDWLAQYPEARRADQQLTVNASSALVRLFSNDYPLLNHARGAALAALDICPTLKQEFSWRGMGFGSGANSLMRGVL